MKPLSWKSWLVIGALFLPLQNTFAIEADEFPLHLNQWPEYPNGANIAALPQLQQVLQRFDESGDYRIIIRHPGGDQGQAWAQQLVNWFVSYGVPASFIDTALGSGNADQLMLVLVNRG